MPPEWMDRLTCQDEEPLWAHGWIPLEPQDALEQQHPYQGHGCWAAIEVLPLQQHCGWAFTLDATPSSYDSRSQIDVDLRAVRTHHVLRTAPQARRHHRRCAWSPNQVHVHFWQDL